MTAFDVTLTDIEAARLRIAGHVRATPAYASQALAARLGRPTFVKHEGLQVGGSFKARGVFNKLLGLDARAGVVTVSGGNHAIATANVAGALGIDALVLMPANAAPYNIELTRSLGARIELCGSAAEAFEAAERQAAAGRLFIHPYDDPAVIAGHGTLGLEFLEACPDLTHVFVSIGGGGMMAGVAAAVKARRPGIIVIGVEPVGAPTMTAAMAAGRPVTIRPDTVSRTLAAPFATERTLAAARAFLDRVVLVEDGPTLADMSWLLQHEKVLAEPAAACVLTAAASLAADLPADAAIGLVLCGSNLALSELDGWRAATTGRG